MSLLRTLLAHTAIYGLSSILGRVINWLLTPLYVHRFPVEDFGILSDLYALLIFVQILLTFGMETSFFFFSRKESDDQPNSYGHAFALVLVLTVVCSLGCMVAYSPLAGALGYAERPELVLLLVPIFAFDALAALPMARLRYLEKPVRFATISLVNIGLTLALNLYWVAVLGWGVEYVLLANVVASGLRLMMALYGNVPQLGHLSRERIRQMYRYGSLIAVAGLLGAINEGIDRNLLPRLWTTDRTFEEKIHTGLALTGIYSAMYKIAMFIALLTQAFRYAVEPLVFRRVGHSQPDRETLAALFHYYGLTCLAAFLLVGSFAYELVSFDAFGWSSRTLIPKAYWMGLAVLPLLLGANVLFGLYQQAAMWYKLSGQLRFGLIYAAAGAAITLGLNVVLIPHFGYYACGFATLICYALMLILCLHGSQQHYPIPYKLKRLRSYALVVLMAWGLNWLIYLRGLTEFPHTMLKLVICLLALGIVWRVERKYPPFPGLFGKGIGQHQDAQPIDPDAGKT